MSTKRIRKRCCIGGCLNTDINTVSLHRVPEDTRSPGIKEKWCRIIRKSKGKPNWVPLKNSVVCGHHFTWRDFHGKRDQGFVKTSLRKEAVPSRKLGPLVTPPTSPPPELEPEPPSPAPRQMNRRPARNSGPASSDDIQKNLVKLQRQLNEVIARKDDEEPPHIVDPNYSEIMNFFGDSSGSFLDLDTDLDLELGPELAGLGEIGDGESEDEFEGESMEEDESFLDEALKRTMESPSLLEVELEEEAEARAPSPVRPLKPRFPCSFCPKSFHRRDHLELHQIIHSADKDRNANDGSKKPRLDTVETPTASSSGVEKSVELNLPKPTKTREWPKRFLNLPPSSTSTAKKPPPLIPISSVAGFWNEPKPKPKIQLVQEVTTGQDDKEDGQRKYKCRFCVKAFSRTDHLKQHLTTHTGSRPFKCHMCPKSFPIVVTLKRHLKTHAGVKDFACKLCPRRFSQIGHLKRHMESPFTHGTGSSQEKVSTNLICRLCSLEFESSEERLSHEQSEHGTNESDVEQQCKFCGEIVLGLRALLTHYQKKHYQKSVQELLVVDGEEEEEVADATFVCRLCSDAFVTREERFSHEILIHKIKNANARLECKYCHKVIQTFNGLAKHIRRHEEAGVDTEEQVDQRQQQQQQQQHKAQEEDAEDQGDSDTNVTAGGSEELISASDVTLWTCRLCPQIFLEQLERLVHENTVHNTKDSSQIHVCKHCSKEIATFRGLTKHLRNIHGERTIPEDQRPRLPTTKKKPIPQPVNTSINAQLVRELFDQEEDSLEESGAGPGMTEMFICRLCDAIFPTIKERLSHENEDHGTRDPNTPLPCKFCNKPTTKFKHYLEHLRRRHGDETFVRVLTDEEVMDPTPRHFLDF